MDASEKRKSERISKNKTLKLRPLKDSPGEGLLVTLISVNISENGILFESASPCKVGDQFRIRFTGANHKFYDEKIRIVRIEEVLTQAHYHIGAAFTAPDPDKIRQLLG